MSVSGTSRRSTRAVFKEQRLFEIIEIRTMDKDVRRKCVAILCLRKFLSTDVCVLIACKISNRVVGCGMSSYARRRRAKSIRRCERCFRIYPPVCNSKCNNRTCKPGLSSNQKVVTYIKYGVTETIPHPWYGFGPF
uniref:RNA silencing suppressor n=1 Tax=Sedum latent virus TaxID=590404 RepID=B9VJM6_9VIRU|nr:putative nucleic acid binding protein [Sedum latent virus]